MVQFVLYKQSGKEMLTVLADALNERLKVLFVHLLVFAYVEYSEPDSIKIFSLKTFEIILWKINGLAIRLKYTRALR